ncbi:MAG: thiamine diphosphokinase [Lachnospiraceae bacterium]|nr:thiamine diphosphokinase [Lachnospiraceae bacterium]
MKIGIASGGTLSAAFLSAFLARETVDYWIAAEGGARLLLSCGIKPDLVVGDFDSVGNAFRKEIADRGIRVLAYPSEKDETDTGLCMAEAVRLCPDEIVLLGGTGTRLDHTLGNIALLLRYAADPQSAGIRIRLVDEHQTAFVLSANEAGTAGPEGRNVGLRFFGGGVGIRKETYPDRYLSVLSLSDRAEGICLAGVYYPLADANLALSDTVGISNRITAEEAVITVRKGTLLIILAKD